MVKEIIHDPLLLGRKAKEAGPGDTGCAEDLRDTLIYHKDTCIGMAANMIGVNKSIIAINDSGNYTIMFNPRITEKHGEYEAYEGCLALTGSPRKTTRYKIITVRYQDMHMKTVTETFFGLTAQIIQHETDHCNGILI